MLLKNCGVQQQQYAGQQKGECGIDVKGQHYFVAGRLLQARIRRQHVLLFTFKDEQIYFTVLHFPDPVIKLSLLQFGQQEQRNALMINV